MKRKGDLFPDVCSIDNLILADKRARKGKRTTYGVRVFDRAKGCNIILLHNMLSDGNFTTSEYQKKKIFEPKERDIFKLPYFPDRIVHHAIMNIVRPIWNGLFISQTYSCIKGRGIHGAFYDIKRLLKTDKENTIYYLKFDITKFYPSIDHDILKSIVRKKIKDKKLLSLLDNIIDSEKGVPIGNYLSQYLANLYLSYFDKWVNDNRYFRYADDGVIFSASKDYLHSKIRGIEKYLNEELNLKLKGNWRVAPVNTGLDFLGYVFRHDYIKLRKSIKKSFGRAAHRGKVKSISSYYGWAKHANCKNLIKKIMGISKANRIGLGNNPPVIENLGDGSSYYNFNVVAGETEDGMPSFDYEQLRFDNPSQTTNIYEVKHIINRKLRINGREEIQ